jgi:hypothetical protein
MSARYAFLELRTGRTRRVCGRYASLGLRNGRTRRVCGRYASLGSPRLTELEIRLVPVPIG